MPKGCVVTHQCLRPASGHTYTRAHLLQTLQDEAALSERQLQVKSSLLELLEEHSQQRPVSKGVIDSPEAACLLRAALKVSGLSMPSFRNDT